MVLACLGRLAESDGVPNTPCLVIREQGLAGCSEDKAGPKKNGEWEQLKAEYAELQAKHLDLM
jgi:hypothetical protein